MVVDQILERLESEAPALGREVGLGRLGLGHRVTRLRKREEALPVLGRG